MSTREWMDRIMADLKGADFNKRLVWKPREGFEVMPFYRSDDLDKLMHVDDFHQLLIGSGTKRNSWLIRQDTDVDDYRDANSKAQYLTGKGVDSLGFRIKDPGSVNEENLSLLLNGIDPVGTELNFSSEGKAAEILDSLKNIIITTGADPAELRGAVEADPLGRLMMNGTLCIPVEEGLDYLASLTQKAAYFPGFRNLQINGSNFTNAGSDCVQELAFSISMAVEYLSALGERGIEPGEAARKIRFSFGVGSGYFMEIAKLRAARILWSVVAEAFNNAKTDDFRMEIHCITSRFNTTIYDECINLLRTQTEAMSAVVGGADSLTVNPFDILSGGHRELSERLARNQQLILREEAYFDRVSDPAGGSYYIENLTSLVAENAWKLFVEIEEKGGFLANLRSRFIQTRLKETAAQRRQDIGRRKEILAGTNLYPDPAEKAAVHEYIVDLVNNKAFVKDLMVEPVRFSRAAEEIEQVRSDVESAGIRPVVFMLTIGNKVMRRARSQFASGLFGCGGFRIIDNDGFVTPEEGVEGALRSGSDIVVICSSDEEYPVYAPEILRGLDGKAIVVIAGNPQNREYLMSQGLENYIHVRSDLTETLEFYNSLLRKRKNLTK
ncbi:MAG: methylmalonyl-CoA mutase family protein [Bacteroidales bacterium]